MFLAEVTVKRDQVWVEGFRKGVGGLEVEAVSVAFSGGEIGIGVCEGSWTGEERRGGVVVRRC